MRAGVLREQLVIQSSTSSQGATGEPVKTWATLDTVWGRAQYLSGRELEQAQKINTQINMEFHIRYRSDVTSKNRISWASKFWNLHAVLPDERKTMLRLMASETV